MPEARGSDDEASGDLISHCAKRVLELCVIPEKRGGAVVNFSRFFFKPSINPVTRNQQQVNDAFPGIAEPGLLTR